MCMPAHAHTYMHNVKGWDVHPHSCSRELTFQSPALSGDNVSPITRMIQTIPPSENGGTFPPNHPNTPGFSTYFRSAQTVLERENHTINFSFVKNPTGSVWRRSDTVTRVSPAKFEKGRPPGLARPIFLSLKFRPFNDQRKKRAGYGLAYVLPHDNKRHQNKLHQRPWKCRDFLL